MAGDVSFFWAPPAGALRPRASLRRLIVHRIQVSQEDASLGDGAGDILAFFCRHPTGVAATGGVMPYPLVVDAEGRAWQCQRLLAPTPHAARYNLCSVGVAVVGDFRAAPPTAAQAAALIELLAHLLDALGLGEAAIDAHDALPGASRQQDKICPGPHLPLPPLRREVAARRRRGPVWLDLAW